MRIFQKISKYISIILIVLSLFGCNDNDEILVDVIANFTFTINDDTVTFINTSEGATAFEWDFGDGSTSTEINPTRTYSSGIFTVRLTASSSNDTSNIFEQDIVITILDEVILFDSGLLTNGDFESGEAPWFGNALDVVTEEDNNFNFTSVETEGNPFDVNLSQEVEIIQGTNYILTFDASSNQARTMLAGIGLNSAPFTAIVSDINLTTETQTFTLQLSAVDFGGEDSRVIFDLGADLGTVVIDNVSLFVGGDGSDTNSADDDDAAEGDSNGGVCPDPDSEDFIVNGNFEAGGTPWELLSSTGATTISTTVSNSCGNNSGRIQTAQTGNPGLKQTRFGVGAILPNTSYVVTFDIRSDANNPLANGSLLNVATFSEASEESGQGAIRHDLVSGDTNIPSTWATRTSRFITASNVDGGLSLLIELIGGGANTSGTIFVDNVSIVLDTGENDGTDENDGEGDSDGRACPDPDSGDFIVNGNFEAGENPWEFLNSTGATTLSITVSKGCGSSSARIQTAPTGNPGVKQTRFGVGTILPNTSYVVTFDIRSDVNDPVANGSLLNVATFSEAAEESGIGAVRHDLVSGDTNIPSTWVTRTSTFITASNVDGGLSVLIELIGGGANTSGTLFIDNVSLVAQE